MPGARAHEGGLDGTQPRNRHLKADRRMVVERAPPVRVRVLDLCLTARGRVVTTAADNARRAYPGNDDDRAGRPTVTGTGSEECSKVRIGINELLGGLDCLRFGHALSYARPAQKLTPSGRFFRDQLLGCLDCRVNSVPYEHCRRDPERAGKGLELLPFFRVNVNGGGDFLACHAPTLPHARVTCKSRPITAIVSRT